MNASSWGTAIRLVGDIATSVAMTQEHKLQKQLLRTHNPVETADKAPAPNQPKACTQTLILSPS